MIKNYLVKNAKYIHFIGIGGISMSGLATLCLKKNIKVSGSDCKDSEILKKLRQKGAIVFTNHDSHHIDCQDLVVYSGAISLNNVELLEAKALKIPCMERSEFLGCLSQKFATSIAVAGTHGKTTTSAMLSKCLIDANFNPEIHIGGETEFLNGTVRSGKDVFVTEACEYRKSFLALKRDYAILLNIEADHLDYYKTIANLQNAFLKFANLSKVLVTSYNLNKIFKFKSQNVVTVSLDNENANFYVKNIVILKNGGHIFDVYKNGVFFHTFSINVIGDFNVFNALCVIALCDELKISKKAVYKSLLTFKGVKRRFERLGNVNNAMVIHDYAHHPTEIEKVINSFKEFYTGKLVVVFQPHTYSRTKDLLKEFLNVLCNPQIDTLIILPTYPAREKSTDGISAKQLNDFLKGKRENAFYMSFGKAKKYLIDFSLNPNVAVLVLGAGDVEMFAKDLVSV